LVLILGFYSPNNFAQSITFNHLSVENGLSNNVVNTVIQDKTGFMWFATEDGLNRYDGYGFKIFRHDPDDSNSISDNSIWALAEDKQGNIWIGTKAGILDRFNPETEKFTHWEIKSEVTEENSITAIFEDSKENIWISTYKDGIYRLVPSTNKLDHWYPKENDDKSLCHNYVHDINEDNEGNILIGTHIGLSKFNPDSPQDGFENFFFNPDDANSLSDNLIWGISKSEFYPDIVWICTLNNLTKFNSQKLIFDRIEIANPDNLQYGKSINSVVEENVNDEKVIWIGSYSGLIRINLTSGTTKRFINDEHNAQSLCNNQINKIIKDRTGVLWIATEDGVSYSTPKSTSFNSISLGGDFSNIISDLKNKNITAISKFEENRIWIGTAKGLYLLDDFETNPAIIMLPEFSDDHIWTLESRNENEIWIGTFGKGLKQFNYKENKITNWDLEDPKIRTQSVYYNKSLLADSKDNIWVGYWGVGAARINPKTGESDVWLNEPGNPQSISHNDVWVIKEDKFGRIWLGTVGGGLNLFEDKENGIFHHWLQREDENIGLNSNNIYSICEVKYLKDHKDSETVL
jgi:ligand-binding sensor domain-containing protein